MNVQWDLKKWTSHGREVLGNAHVPPGACDWGGEAGHIPRRVHIFVDQKCVCLLALKQGSGGFCKRTLMAVTCSSEEKLPERAWRDPSRVLPLVFQVWVVNVSWTDSVF